MRELTPRRKRLFTLIMVLIPFVIPFTIAEVYLRIQGDLSTYSEKVGNGYRSYYNENFEGSLWKHRSNYRFVMDHGDFEYEYLTNEFGIREKKELLAQPADSNAIRIITFGDSFTEGVGAPYDSAWPRAMEQKLAELVIDSGRSVEVYNAGVGGSDPVFNYMMLKEKLLGFKPDLVIQSVNTSDLADFLFRDGLERYAQGRTNFRNGPWWEIPYRFSYIVRLIVHGQLEYDFMLVKEKTRLLRYKEAVQEYHHLFSDFMQPMADSCGFEVVYLIQPMPDEVRYDCCNYNYLTSLDSLLKDEGWNSVDMIRPMQKAIGEDPEHKYDWPIDKHYNGRGYRVLGELMGDTIFDLAQSGKLKLD